MNEEAFLSALRENPSDELTWSALADWLDEEGQSERAELVRLTRRLGTLPVMARTKRRAALEDGVVALLLAGTRPVAPEITNSLGMRLALIPPGRFRMGSPRAESGRGPSESTREVTLTRPFYLGVFAVTQAQYESVMASNPSHFSAKGHSFDSVIGMDTSDFPVEGLSWIDAVEFCRRLSEREGRTYRLPTESEWEYACRAGTTTPFHLGDELSPGQANLSWMGSHTSPLSIDRTCSVGSYAPNAWGLHDLHGNVFEWCQDWFDAYIPDDVTDPRGPPTGRGRVVRGGFWSTYPYACRSAFRNNFVPTTCGDFIGFRVAAD